MILHLDCIFVSQMALVSIHLFSFSTGLIIGEGLLHVDPDTQEEMQRKKEKFMMLSLKRKQQVFYDFNFERFFCRLEILLLFVRPRRIVNVKMRSFA